MANRTHLSRRQFLKSGVFLGATLPLGALAQGGDEPFTVEQVQFPVPNLPDAFKQFKIGFMSDIHLSAFLASDLLERAIAFLKGQELDLLLMGGDYIWRPREMLREVFPVYRKEFGDLEHPDLVPHIYRALIEMISDIKPRHGIFAVLGNHDRWAASPYCESAFSNTPVRLLLNQNTVIEKDGKKLEIIGTDDFLTGQPRFPASFENSPDIRLLLTHNPDILRWYLGREKIHFDGALMGHTHGGQICAARGVPIVYNITDTDYGVGLVKHPTGCYCYTSRGIGCVGIPLRVNCPPEVTLASFIQGS